MEYSELEFEVIRFTSDDVITASCTAGIGNDDVCNTDGTGGGCPVGLGMDN